MSINPVATPAIAPLYRLQYEAVQGSWVLLYPEGMVKLNGPAAEVLRRCDGQRSVEQLIAELKREFGAAPSLTADVCEFLSDAHGRGWVVTPPPEAPSAPPPQGGAASGPAKPDPRRPPGGVV